MIWGRNDLRTNCMRTNYLRTKWLGNKMIWGWIVSSQKVSLLLEGKCNIQFKARVWLRVNSCRVVSHSGFGYASTKKIEAVSLYSSSNNVGKSGYSTSTALVGLSKSNFHPQIRRHGVFMPFQLEWCFECVWALPVRNVKQLWFQL